MTSIAISGNTYPVKDQIKALGGRWNPTSKAWMVPADKADAARKLVAGATKTTYTPARSTGGYIRERVYGGGSGSRSSGWTGCSCGSIEGRPRNSDCASCQHDY